MDNGRWVTYWRIATSSGGLATGHFIALGLPPPDLPDYKPFTQLMPQSQGGQTEQGYITIDILWDQMDYQQVQTLQRIVDGVTNSTLWMTVDRGHAGGLNDFIDVSGIVRPLQFDSVSKARGVMYGNVKLTVTNISIISDPSTVFN